LSRRGRGVETDGRPGKRRLSPLQGCKDIATGLGQVATAFSNDSAVVHDDRSAAHRLPLQASSMLITIDSVVLSISSEQRHLRQLRAA
jgi:hypothetical protein